MENVLIGPLLSASQDTWLRGLLFGAGLVLTLQFVAVLGAALAPATTTTTTAPFEWDAPAAAAAAAADTDTAAWLNVVVARFFLALRDSALFKDKICAKLMDRLNSKLLASQNMFVSHVRLHDLSLGDNVPRILGVRMLKGLTEDLAVVRASIAAFKIKQATELVVG
ncbi:hypothetical protein BDR26DRAFT_379496 [Obelidium mucronatum]|nr:hypothetical protein BDR26DRAFT_379496 [Obelidium mucronatum]